MKRTAQIKRVTNETEIFSELNIDGRGISDIKTGIGFLDHMLNLFACHGLIDLNLRAKGDLEVDAHHTVEDIGIALGELFLNALDKKEGIARYGSASIPMDDVLTSIVIDISGRPFLIFNCKFHTDKVGNFDLELIEEFMRAFSNNLRCNLHINTLYGQNSHHIAESIFKGLGKAIDEATRLDDRIKGALMTTKGKL